MNVGRGYVMTRVGIELLGQLKTIQLNTTSFTCRCVPTSLDALVQFEKLGCDTIYEDKALCSARYILI